MNLLKKIKANVVISACMCILLGIVLVVWPELSMHIVCMAVGAVLLVGGVVRLAVYLANLKETNVYAQMNLILGIVLAVVGVWIMLQPDKVLAIIPLIVGIVIVLHGINDLSQAVTLCKNKYDLWWLALLFGVVTLGFGAFLIYRPIAALDTAVMMIGIFLIYDGLSDIWIVSRIYRSARQLHQELEAVDAEAREIR